MNRFLKIGIFCLLCGLISSCSSTSSLGDPLAPPPTATQPPTATLPPSATPTPVLPFTGKLAYASDQDGDYEIFIIPAQTGIYVQLTHNEIDDRHPAISPDGSQIAYVSRVDDYFTWGAPVFANYTHDELRIGDSLGFHNRPNAKFQKWEINSHGFRSPETTREKPDSVIRVIMTGASETFGLLESPGMEYSAQMQSILQSLTA